jgi:hypothetical protein
MNEQALRSVIEYVESQGESTSHLLVSRALRPNRVMTKTHDLSMQTLPYYSTLGEFEHLNLSQVAMQNQDWALLRWHHKGWWHGFVIGLVVAPLWLPLLVGALCLLMACVIPVLCVLTLGDAVAHLYGGRWRRVALLLLIWSADLMLHRTLPQQDAVLVIAVLVGYVHFIGFQICYHSAKTSAEKAQTIAALFLLGPPITALPALLK